MKWTHYVLLLLLLTSIMGCTTFGSKKSKSYLLPKHEKILTNMSGSVYFKGSPVKRILFENALVTTNGVLIRIESKIIKQTILWKNVKKLVIINNK